MGEAFKLSEFQEEDRTIPIRFVETTQVAPGVNCDVYEFIGDNSRDLAVVTVQSGSKTPLQRVVGGDRTWEGFLAGEGNLTIVRPDAGATTFKYTGEIQPPVLVERGEIMQWHASGEGSLTFYEICEPKYAEGRFENLSE